MDFFSLQFLIFVTATFIIYYLLFLTNKSVKRTIIPQWSVLLIASLVFYGFTNYIYLIYLAISSLISYFVAILCQHKLFKRTSNPEAAEYELDRELERNTYIKNRKILPLCPLFHTAVCELTYRLKEAMDLLFLTFL